jgi:FkbM family methyltransferase
MSKIFKKFCGIFGYKLFEKDYIKSRRYLFKLNSLNLENIIRNLVEKKIINSLIQIGACDGVKGDFLTNTIKEFRLKSILLEPIKKNFTELQKTYLNYENVKIENSALSVNNEIHFLYKVDANHSNKYGQAIIDVIPSFYKDHLIKHGIKKKHIVKEKVNQIGFNELLKKYSIEKFDLLAIDTESYDCHIVNNFFLKIEKIRPIVIFEWSNTLNNLLETTLNDIIKRNYSFYVLENDILCLPAEKNILLQINK